MVHHASSGRNEVRHLECGDLSPLLLRLRPVAAVSEPGVITRRQATAGKSADRSAHSKSCVLHCVKLFAKREWALV